MSDAQSPPQWRSPDLRRKPVGADAPALRQAKAVRPAGLQTQPALSQHTGHRFLLRDPEGAIEREEESSQWEVLLQQWRTDGSNWLVALFE